MSSPDAPLYVKLPITSDTIYEAYMLNPETPDESIAFLLRHRRDPVSILISIPITSLLHAIKMVKGVE